MSFQGLPRITGPDSPESTFDLCLAYNLRGAARIAGIQDINAPGVAARLIGAEADFTEVITILDAGTVPLLESAQRLLARCLYKRSLVSCDLQKRDAFFRDARRLIKLHEESQRKPSSFDLKPVEIGQAYLLLGRELYREQKPDTNAAEIGGVIERGLSLTPKDRWHWTEPAALADSYGHLRQWDKAIRWQKEAIGLAGAPARKKDLQQGLAHLEQQAKMSPGM